MILYYTLYNSSFPHVESKFLYFIIIIRLQIDNSSLLEYITYTHLNEYRVLRIEYNSMRM